MSDSYRPLRGRIVEKYGSVKNFSTKVGQNYQNVCNKLNGKTKISTEEAQIWAEALGIERAEIGFFLMPANSTPSVESLTEC